MGTKKLWSCALGASLELAPDIEGTDTVLMNGGTAVARVQPEDPELCIGRRVRSILKSHRHHRPTDSTQASQIPPGRASGDRLLSSRHQGTSTPRETHISENVGMQLVSAQEIRTSQRCSPKNVRKFLDQSHISTTLMAPTVFCRTPSPGKAPKH